MRAERKIRAMSDDNVIEVYATQYIPVDGSSVFEVALPDKYLKFANLGWSYEYDDPTYTINLASLNRGTAVYDVPVNDVGPWNEDDNYWDINRRIFDDIELGLPEAEAAFFENYNDQKDQFGRIVTNPAGVDMSPAVAKQLGFRENESGWLSIYLNF